MKESMKIKNIICVILTIALLAFATNAYAANDHFITTLDVNKSSVKRGEKITVTISIGDIIIESGEKGIGAYIAKLEFNPSILEYVETNGTDRWEAPLYENMKIVGNTNDGEVVKTSQSIGTITFKVKEDATLGETTISLVNFSGSTAKTDVIADNTSTAITIINDDVDNQNEGGDQIQGRSRSQEENSSESGNQDENSNEGESGSQGENSNENKNGNQSGNLNENGSQNENNDTQNELNSNEIYNTNGTNENTTKKDNVSETEGTKSSNFAIIAIYILTGIIILIAIYFGIKIKLINNKKKNN